VQRSLSRPLVELAPVELAPVELSVLGADPGIVMVYGWQNMTFAIWRAPASASSIELLRRLGALLHERYPQGISSVHVLAPGQTQLPSADVRAGFVRLINEHADWLGGNAVVIASSGFWASAMRSVVTAMRVLGPRTLELRIHSRLDEVAQWLPASHLKRTGVKIEPDELLRALRQAERTEPAAL